MLPTTQQRLELFSLAEKTSPAIPQVVNQQYLLSAHAIKFSAYFESRANQALLKFF